MRVYKHSINKYRINLITKQDEVPVTVDLWGTELGIQEWIEANKMEDAIDEPVYEVMEYGPVQEGQPIPEWSY